MIVGHKRVERNIARWKHDDEIMNEAKQPGAMAVMPTDARNRLITMQMADPVADPPGDCVEATCRGA